MKRHLCSAGNHRNKPSERRSVGDARAGALSKAEAREEAASPSASCTVWHGILGIHPRGNSVVTRRDALVQVAMKALEH